MKVTILILAKDEAECLPTILPQIDKSWADQWLLIDGQSTDDTVKVAESFGFETYVQQTPGIRHAYIEAMPLCMGDVILTLSPDGNCDMSKIPEMIAKIQEGYDLVIGSRYLNCKSEDDNWFTGLGNWSFNFLARILFGSKLTDVMGIYRIFRKDLVYYLALDQEGTYLWFERLLGTTISWEPIMSIRAIKDGWKVAEISAGEPKRLGGVRKLQPFKWGSCYYLQFLAEWWNS